MNIFWFKRDLRIADNEALSLACKSKDPLLLVYILEPSLVKNSHTSKRHINFIKESLQDLNNELKPFETEILLVENEVEQTFETLIEQFKISKVFSTQEIGVDVTFKRDIRMSKWFNKNNIEWIETQYNGVLRGLKNRKGWSAAWKKYMTAPEELPDLGTCCLFSIDEVKTFQKLHPVINCKVPQHNFQRGGRTEALNWANSFFDSRIFRYSEGISKPELSRITCSRLSPYFAWGNLSIREIYKRAIVLKQTAPSKKPINAFLSRLRWQSHFIQKFEMEPRMEFEAINKAYLALEQSTNKHYISAWKNGKTGYPLVDASIRALKETGYINFRMRSMVVSFFVHHLFQHFSEMSDWLGQQFLDFEPGIHYGQLQMQSGFTGTNTIRIYNPTRNAHDHDSEAVFIKNWVPELASLPPVLAIEPWLITAMESEMYNFKVGVDYPERIIDTSEARKLTLKKLYEMRNSLHFKKEKQRILDRHTIKRTYN